MNLISNKPIPGLLEIATPMQLFFIGVGLFVAALVTHVVMRKVEDEGSITDLMFSVVTWALTIASFMVMFVAFVGTAKS